MLIPSETRAFYKYKDAGLTSGRSLLQIVCLLLLSFPLFAEDSRTLFLEADADAEVVPPAAVVPHIGANGGRCVCISAPNAPAMVTGSDSRRGQLVFRPNLVHAGDYRLWIRLQWHCICSRAVSLTTSGSYDPGFESDMEAVADYEPSNVWHWTSCGPISFATGQQTITFTQKGHLALFDSIILTAEPDYHPTGFTPSSEPLKIEAASAEWRRVEDGLYLQFPSKREWDSFVAEMVCDFRTESPSAQNDRVGIQFGIQESGECCRFLCSRHTHEGNVSLALLCQGAEPVILATGTAVLNRDFFQHFRFSRVGGRIVVWVNGVPAIEARDVRYPSGKIGLISGSPVFGAYEHLTVRSLSEYEDTFADPEATWESLRGKWKAVSLESIAPDAGGGYAAIGEDTNLALSPFAVGDECFVTVKVRLAETGYGGLAFDVSDDRNFMALVLQEDSDLQRNKAQARLLRFKDSGTQTLWEGTYEGIVGQWRDISLLWRDGFVEVSVDEDKRWVVPASLTNTERGRGLGLVASGGSGAVFASPKAHDHVEGVNWQFLFEPDRCIQSLCHWAQEEGRFSLFPYYAQLRCEPLPGQRDFALTLRRRLPPGFETSIDFHESGTDPNESTRLPDDGLPEVVLPVLPGDPRVGIGIRMAKPGDETGRTEYRISVDLREMRDLAVFRNGEKVPPASPLGFGDRTEESLFLRFSGQKIEAGVRGGVHARIADLPPMDPSTEVQVFFFAENIEEGRRIDVQRIVVREVFDL